MSRTTPLVSVLLPTYNRAAFLSEALDSIARQTLSDWELVVVDDGSTDETRAVVQGLTSRFSQRTTYLYQPNRGAYGARNTALDHATGEFVAFFDSDDLWLPEHLERCLAAFRAAPRLDWAFAACRQVDANGRTVQPTTFEVDGKPLPFLSAPVTTVDGVNILEPRDALKAQLQGGLYSGLQNSLIRRQVFDGHRFWEDYRVVEDSLFLLRALGRGLRIGYRREVQVIYRIHEGNSSASATSLSLENLRRICLESVQGLERVRAEKILPLEAAGDLDKSLAEIYFWRLGYACHWRAGDAEHALEAMRAGRRLAPRDRAMLKTYLVTLLRSRFRRS